MIRLPRKSILIAAIGACTLSAWLLGYRENSRLQHQAAQVQAELQNVKEQLAATQSELSRLHRTLELTKQAHDDATHAAIAAEARLASATNSPDWLKPPVNWPEWNPQSPYIWLHKDVLRRLEITPFSKDGALKPLMASMLSIPPAQLERVNKQLSQILDHHHDLELARTEVLQTASPDPTAPERTVTIRVGSTGEEGAKLDHQVETTLQQELGVDRANILSESASTWLSDAFGNAGRSSRTISVMRHPDGTGQFTMITEDSQPRPEGGPPFTINRGTSVVAPSVRSERTVWFVDPGFLDKPNALAYYIPTRFLPYFEALSPMRQEP